MRKLREKVADTIDINKEIATEIVTSINSLNNFINREGIRLPAENNT